MKIVVIGGTGLIGSKVVALLREQGHEVVAASPGTGVDTLTGAGVAEALAGARVVVDVTNSPSFEPDAVLDFFTTSTRTIQAAAVEAGVGHQVALSIVGVERSPGNAYFRAKVAQEELIAAGPVPWTIVRATQFFEFTAAIAATATEGDTVRIAPVAYQPIAADEVAAAVAGAAVSDPANDRVQIAGPDRFRFDELVRDALAAWGDPRTVVADPAAAYFGAVPEEDGLVPADGAARLGTVRFADWLRTGR